MSSAPTSHSELDSIDPFNLEILASLATLGLTKLVDREREGLPYFIGEWRANPPRAEHNFWDYGDGSGRLLDALTLCGIISKPDAEAAEVVELLNHWVLKQLGPDGLSWVPSEPWVKPWGDDALFVHAPLEGGFCEVSWSQRGTMMGLLSKFLHSEDEIYLERAKNLVDGLKAIAVKHEDGLYFPDVYYQRVGWQTTRHDVDPVMVEYNAASLAAIIRFYESTGYQPALELASGIANFALKYTKGYDDKGTFLIPGGNLGSHFHTRSNFVLGLLKYGLVEKREDLISWAESSYAQLRNFGSEFGWFPEGIGMRHGEICCTTDMIELALLLGTNVDRKYFSDAEKFGRNHLIESQWRSLSMLENALAKITPPTSEQLNFPDYVTQDKVTQRQIGAFSSRPAMNDGFHLDATALMQCCNAAGARALYDLWRYTSAYTQSDSTNIISINLRFSIENEHIRIISHEPRAGMLEIKVKMDSQVQVRLPQGTTHATVYIGDIATSLVAIDGYVEFAARVEENIKIAYTLQEREENYMVGEGASRQVIQGFWRGETMLRVAPEGDYYPFYIRRWNRPPAYPKSSNSRIIDSL